MRLNINRINLPFDIYTVKWIHTSLSCIVFLSWMDVHVSYIARYRAYLARTAVDTTFTRADRLPFRIIISVWHEVYRTAARVISPEDANSRVVNLVTREYTQTREISFNRNQSRISFFRRS